MIRLALILAALALASCTPLIVRAKCGPDGANDWHAGRFGFPTHINCDRLQGEDMVRGEPRRWRERPAEER